MFKTYALLVIRGLLYSAAVDIIIIISLSLFLFGFFYKYFTGESVNAVNFNTCTTIMFYFNVRLYRGT